MAHSGGYCANGNHRSAVPSYRAVFADAAGHNVSLSNLRVPNAILYVAGQGCKGRGLPKRFGNGHTLYSRMNRWSRNGVLDRVFAQLQRDQIIRIKIEAVALDGTAVKVHPGGAEENGAPAIGKSRSGWTTRMPMVAANARTAIAFALSPGNARDAPGGYRLLRDPGKAPWPVHLLMDRAQEGDEARQLAPEPGFVPGGSPRRRTGFAPWECHRAMDRRRNETERPFRRLKGLRRIFSRFEKLDVMFIGFINCAPIADGLRIV